MTWTGEMVSVCPKGGRCIRSTATPSCGALCAVLVEVSLACPRAANTPPSGVALKALLDSSSALSHAEVRLDGRAASRAGPLDLTTMPLSSREKNLAAAAEINRRVDGLVTDSAVGIIGSVSQNIRALGSGTLLAVGDVHFIVSAGHVIRDGKRLDATLAIGSGSSNLLATTRPWLISGDEEETDVHDIALYRLTSEEAGRLAQAKFVRIGDVDFSPDLSDAFFAVAGFPSMWTDAASTVGEPIRSRLAVYGTTSYERSSSGLEGFDAERHILLAAPREEMYNETGDLVGFRTRSGFPTDFPDGLRGISGCGIWRLGSLRQTPALWGQPRLVGVETAVYNKAQAIRGTRWNSVTTFLHGAVPELRPVLQFYIDAYDLR